MKTLACVSFGLLSLAALVSPIIEAMQCQLY